MTDIPSVLPEEAASRRGRRPPSQTHPHQPMPAADVRRITMSGHHTRCEPADQALHSMRDLWRRTHGDGDEATWDSMSYGPFSDPAAMDGWFTNASASADPCFWVVTDTATEVTMGMAALMSIRPDHGVAELGNIWFAPDARGTAATTEAMYLLMRHAMTLGYRRLEWKCDAANLTSRRAALRLGFRFEGVFLNHMVIKGRNRDTAWFSITDDEWPAVQAEIETWLSPTNFDAAGRQRTSLSLATHALW